MSDKSSLLDSVARLRVFDGLPPNRVIPLLEIAELVTLERGETLFEQFHPAARCYLLMSGSATRSTSGSARTELVHHESVDWPYAAIGWSGFVAPQRYGSTVVARDTITPTA